LRNGWTICQLGDVIVSGKTIDPTKTPTRKFEYVDVSGVSNKTFRIEQTSEIIGSGAPSRARRQIKSGDIIFATIRPTLKRIAVVPPELDGEVCSTAFFVFRTRPNLDPKFLFYYLFTDIFMGGMESLQTGASYPAVNDTQVREQKIAFPALPEQKRIVAILDEAFEGIDAAVGNAEKNLANARELLEIYTDSVFSNPRNGWYEKKLKDVCEKITDGTHQTPTYFDKGVVFLSSRNVTTGFIDWDKIKYIDQKQHLEMHRRVAPRRNDILLAKNGTTGVAAIVDRDTVFDIYVSLALLRALSVIRPQLLLHFINSTVAKRQFNKRLKGIGVPNLHLEEIREVTIAFPSSLSEQDAVVDKLDALRGEAARLEGIYQQKIAALSELKQAILQKAFAGELTARDMEAVQEAAE
jgi:type I restriction enzyme S subunit